MMLVGAGSLQSFTRMTHVAVGFRSEGLLTMRVSLPTTTYADAAAMRSFMGRLIPRLESIPGVASAAASMALPPTITTMAPYVPGDQPLIAIGERPVGQWSAITPGYFSTLGFSWSRRGSRADTKASPWASSSARTWAPGSGRERRRLQEASVGRFPGSPTFGVTAT